MDRKCFPRGGAQENHVVSCRKFVFEKNKPRKKKNKKNLQKKPKKFVPIPKVPAPEHQHLTRNDLKPGLVTICAVHSIFSNYIAVNLPQCSMRAYLLASDIFNGEFNFESDKKLFSKLFYIGQLLSCKLIKKPDNCGDLLKEDYLFVTTVPSIVNCKLNSGMIKKNSCLQMSVSSVEDHGYMLDSGIPGVMAFLPLKHAKMYSAKYLGSQLLNVGTILWCCVVKSSVNSSGSNVVEVRLPGDDINEMPHKITSNFIWPGCRVDTTILWVFDDNCCQVSVDGTMIQGLVKDDIDYNKDRSVPYLEGSSSPATLISYHPQLNIFNFSFSHDLLLKPEPYNMLCKDQKFKATVDYITDKFLYLNISNMDYKGVVLLKPNSDKEDEKQVQKKYNIGDQVTVLILNADHFRRTHLCCIEEKSETEDNENKKNKKNKKKNKEHESITDDVIKKERVDIEQDVYGEDSGIDTKGNKKSKKKKKKQAGEEKQDDDGYCYQNDCDIEIKEESINEDTSDSDVEIKDESISEDSSNSDVEIGNSIINKNPTSPSKIKNAVEINPKKRKHENILDEKINKKIKSYNGNNVSDVIKQKMEEASKLSIQDVDTQFIWDATPDDLAKVTNKDVEDFEEESDDEKVGKKVLTKSQKKANELEKERKIQEKEAELLKAYEDPKSADHYERIILSRPDDSKVWIKYMAFHLEATEIEKAKAVGSRALKIISARNEQDRLNVWLAMLNLEHLYGSKETFKETWVESLKCNDDYKINSKVLELFSSSQNSVEVSNLVQKMTKQYRENSECWYLCFSALMSSGLEDKARELLQRSLKALPPKTHVSLISRFALLENTNGHSDESQALFDNLLTSYPSRVDIWFVYIDMLIKSNKNDLARQVFERATSMKLPAKKMKSIYKKWLEFEEKNGDEESVSLVRKSALKYVEQATKEINA